MIYVTVHSRIGFVILTASDISINTTPRQINLTYEGGTTQRITIGEGGVTGFDVEYLTRMYQFREEDVN